eukprot:352952-Chlamydomonas_euryale.AAC.2
MATGNDGSNLGSRLCNPGSSQSVSSSPAEQCGECGIGNGVAWRLRQGNIRRTGGLEAAAWRLTCS